MARSGWCSKKSLGPPPGRAGGGPEPAASSMDPKVGQAETVPDRLARLGPSSSACPRSRRPDASVIAAATSCVHAVLSGRAAAHLQGGGRSGRGSAAPGPGRPVLERPATRSSAPGGGGQVPGRRSAGGPHEAPRERLLGGLGRRGRWQLKLADGPADGRTAARNDELDQPGMLGRPSFDAAPEDPAGGGWRPDHRVSAEDTAQVWLPPQLLYPMQERCRAGAQGDTLG